jgi:hypothetical protein
MDEVGKILITATVTFVAAVLGSIVAPFIKARLDHQLEQSRASLAREAKVRDKELGIVGEMHATIDELFQALRRHSNVYVFSSNEVSSFEARVDELTAVFRHHEIYLSRDVRSAFDRVIFIFRRAAIYVSRASRLSLDDTERDEARNQLRECVSHDLELAVTNVKSVSRCLARGDS